MQKLTSVIASRALNKIASIGGAPAASKLYSDAQGESFDHLRNKHGQFDLDDVAKYLRKSASAFTVGLNKMASAGYLTKQADWAQRGRDIRRNIQSQTRHAADFVLGGSSGRSYNQQVSDFFTGRGRNDAARALVNDARNTAVNAWNGAKQGAGVAWNGAKQGAGKAWNGAKQTANTAWNGAKQGANNAWNFTKGLVGF